MLKINRCSVKVFMGRTRNQTSSNKDTTSIGLSVLCQTNMIFVEMKNVGCLLSLRSGSDNLGMIENRLKKNMKAHNLCILNAGRPVGSTSNNLNLGLCEE